VRFSVLRADRRWRHPHNHLDGRICPICAATVHGTQGQAVHIDWHVELVRMAEAVEQVAGIGQQDGPPVPWTPAEDEHDEQEAAQ